MDAQAAMLERARWQTRDGITLLDGQPPMDFVATDGTPHQG
ncbi:MAG: hypothetical protein PHO07_06865 [Pirellulales bacterium]|nr:hypothetical protein [Thermoguttaceae bacterium]MDD4786879.1 hypothetical protein [Pirellulales bacterium]MDI9446316.1 hypothetical protein [Planctomycetota bacterium]